MPFSKKVICGSTFILQFTTLPLEDQVIAPSQHLMLFGVIWCNNCENCGNYGDDCEQLRNRPSVAFWNKKLPLGICNLFNFCICHFKSGCELVGGGSILMKLIWSERKIWIGSGGNYVSKWMGSRVLLITGSIFIYIWTLDGKKAIWIASMQIWPTNISTKKAYIIRLTEVATKQHKSPKEPWKTCK